MKKALVLIEVHSAIEGNMATVWVVIDSLSIPKELDDKSGAKKAYGPLPYSDAEVLSDRLVKILQGLNIECHKLVTVDD